MLLNCKTKYTILFFNTFFLSPLFHSLSLPLPFLPFFPFIRHTVQMVTKDLFALFSWVSEACTIHTQFWVCFINYQSNLHFRRVCWSTSVSLFYRWWCLSILILLYVCCAPWWNAKNFWHLVWKWLTKDSFISFLKSSFCDRAILLEKHYLKIYRILQNLCRCSCSSACSG